VSAEERVELDKLIEKLEEDEDVQNVYHTLDIEE
jgi:transcriptional/translational regulatory protein YebC/TACO1